VSFISTSFLKIIRGNNRNLFTIVFFIYQDSLENFSG
jgi:hypothetical protein